MDPLDAFVAQFTTRRIPHVLRGDSYFTPPRKEPAADAPLLYMTTRLGRLRRSGFRPSVALLDVLARRTDRRAVVNEKSAWLFLCGRNVLKEGIVSSPPDGPVLVLNRRGEVLGYGKRTGAGITNLLDRGDFLRRER